jgi:mono/diheme cytochrome c family protein
MIPVLAVSIQRSIGLTVAVIVLLGFAAYALVNVFRSGRREVGSEIELAPNRKPYLSDEELETKKLDVALFAGVATLAVIALALPLYWLGEPGRQDGRVAFTTLQFGDRGRDSFEERCSGCHGAEGVGGVASYVVTDENSRFVASSSWTAPALNTIFSRYSPETVTEILQYGRPQSPMPAWGILGGGPLTDQQLEELIVYLQRIQLDPTVEEDRATIDEQINEGVLEVAREKVQELDPALTEAVEAAATAAEEANIAKTAADEAGDDDAAAEAQAAADAARADGEAARAAIDAAAEAYVADATPEQLGELLFANPAAGGSYGCARCHTAGRSWNKDGLIEANPNLAGLLEPEAPGCGGFGPSLCGGHLAAQFATPQSQAAFITGGCSTGIRYGRDGYCDSGQMPGFGGILAREQIDAIVAYERGL